MHGCNVLKRAGWVWNDTAKHEGDGATEFAQTCRDKSAWQPVIWLMRLFKEQK